MSLQKIRRRRFGDILVSEGVIDQEQLQSALARQTETGESLGEILLAQKMLTESDIVRTICLQFQLPFINPTQYEIDTSLLEAFTPSFLFEHQLLPMDRIGDVVLVALGAIPSEAIEAELAKKLGGQPAYFFCPFTEVETYLRNQFSLSQDEILAIEDSRRRRNRTGKGPVATVAVQERLLDSLDSSWEAIFDEAEKNVDG